MALVAFIAGSILGLVGAVYAGVALGFGFAAAFAIYATIATLFPLTALFVTIGRDTDPDGVAAYASA